MLLTLKSKAFIWRWVGRKNLPIKSGGALRSVLWIVFFLFTQAFAFSRDYKKMCEKKYFECSEQHFNIRCIAELNDCLKKYKVDLKSEIKKGIKKNQDKYFKIEMALIGGQKIGRYLKLKIESPLFNKLDLSSDTLSNSKGSSIAVGTGGVDKAIYMTIHDDDFYFYKNFKRITPFPGRGFPRFLKGRKFYELGGSRFSEIPMRDFYLDYEKRIFGVFYQGDWRFHGQKLFGVRFPIVFGGEFVGTIQLLKTRAHGPSGILILFDQRVLIENLEQISIPK